MFYQQIYRDEIEELGEIETYSRLCVSSKWVYLFETGKEYIAQGRYRSKVKSIDEKESCCMNLTFLQQNRQI